MGDSRAIRVLWSYSINGYTLYHCELDSAEGVKLKDVEYSNLVSSMKKHNIFDAVLSDEGCILKADGSEIPHYSVKDPTAFQCPTRSALDLKGLLRADNIRQHRTIKGQLDDFCVKPLKKILGVYGLRRTGKSVLMRSKALELMNQGKSVVYFDFELNRRASFDDLISDLKLCKEMNVEFVFIDEVTFLSAEVTAELSGKKYLVPEFPTRGMEIYAHTISAGIRVILSGTDSYCLSLARESSLFDRMEFLSTTYIPFQEYTKLVGYVQIAEYMKTGGILPRQEIDWNEYTETAVINNIITSIEAVHPTKYRYLSEFKNGEIRSLILYTMAMTNIEFIERFFIREYGYPELMEGVDLLRKGENPILFPRDFIYNIKNRLRKDLFLTQIDSSLLSFVLAEMEEVLLALDVITPYNLNLTIRSKDGVVQHTQTVYALSVPGLRAYQFKKTLWAVEDEIKNAARVEDKNALIKKIKENAEGHLLESLILSETVRFLPKDTYKVSQYRLFNNEVDMVVENTGSGQVSLFEVKRSDKAAQEQAKHFLATSFVGEFISTFPDLRINSFNILYMGGSHADTFTHEQAGVPVTVNYINAEQYLLKIDSWV